MATILPKPVTIMVPGDPVPKARPRLHRGRVYTPQHIRSFQEMVGWLARQAGIRDPLSGPLVLELTFYRRTRRRCDLDNLVKAVLDGLNGVAYTDDSQVTGLVVWQGVDREHPRVEISLYTGGDPAEKA